MGKINVLDTKLANMIAAGEVVERPSSVIKELVENSIDAHAKNIVVKVYEAGRKKIVVEDDGDGMDCDDAVLAFKRHATSKISSTFDLFRIRTLGFRGEALPSIASVSKMKVTTSTGQDEGTALYIVNEEIQKSAASLRKGTVIEVEELFYNTPARLKYLKTDYTENANNLEIMTRLALAHPEISIKFFIDERLQFQTTGRGDRLEVIANIYGYSVAKSMIYFEYNATDYSVNGYLGKPDIAKSSRYYTITLLNGRNVYMPKVQTAIKDAYSDFIPPTKYPFCILNFDVDFALVDVNVHPSKKEVRFSKEDELRLALLKEIPLALKPKTIFDEVSIFKDEDDKKQTNKAEKKYEKIDLFETTENIKETKTVTFKENYKENDIGSKETLFEKEWDYETVEENIALTPKENKQSPIIPLAQLNKTYIIGEDVNSDGGFYLIDQHAAMERINYEYFTKLYENKVITMRPLIPEVVNLNPSEYILFNDEKKAALRKIGLDFEPFGIHAYKVVAIPTWLHKDDERYFIDELIHMALYADKIDEFKLRKHAIATMACKASLKANMNCSMSEAQVLLDRLFSCDNPHNCPHGRPIIIKFSKYDLEKMFKRTGV